MATGLEARSSARQRCWQFSGVELTGAKSVSSATTLTFSDPRFVYLDASGGAFTLTLPATPYEGLTFHLSENANDATAITVDGNGKNNNAAASLTMNAAFRQRVLRYNGTQWITISGIG